VTSFSFDKRILDEAQIFDAFAAPLFHKGNDVGCLVLHGIGGTPANVRYLADRLIKEGYTVSAPLIAGHGQTLRTMRASSGKEWLASVEAAVRELREAGCTKIVPIGLSLGSVLAGLVAKDADALVLISSPITLLPYLHASRFLARFVPAVRYGQDHHDRVNAAAPYGQMHSGFSPKNLWDLQFLRKKLLRLLPSIACPTLAIWAEKDDKVAPSASARLRRLLSAPLTEITLKNAPHGLTYDPAFREPTADHVARFLADRLDNPIAKPL